VVDFTQRGTTPELMDTEVVSYADFRTCLEQLTQANGVFLPYRPTLSFLDRLRTAGRFTGDKPVSIVDVGCGYGDTLRRIDRWAERHGIAVDLQGVDRNPWSARAAADVTAPGRPIRWITQDLFEYRPDGEIDIVISSLFAHHLPEAKLAHFVAWMEANTRLGWFVNDLLRHPLAYHGLRAGFWLTNRHRFLRHDGPVSIANAFRRADWERTIASAGPVPGGVSIETWFLFRLCVARTKG
jgi:SAM-dependent methyltransferase